MTKVNFIVFLDRDGTVTKEMGLINHVSRLELEPLASSGIFSLNRLNVPVIILTNQPGVGREIISSQLLADTHERLEQLLEYEQAHVDGIFTCPHLPNDDSCICHKPETGLAHQALAHLRLSPKRIYVVGDRSSDVQLAANLGGSGILVLTGYGRGEWENQRQSFATPPVYIAENLDDAVRWILLQEQQHGFEGLPTPQYRWPDIDTEVEKTVIRQLHTSISIGDNSGIIGNLESTWAKQTGRKFAVSFCTGTMALFAAFRALNIRRGDEVIVPAYGFFATASPLLSLGAIPVFVDVDASGNLDPNALEGAITSKTRALVISHIFGVPADMQRISEIASRRKLTVIEDASHAFGAMREGIQVGQCGKLAVFSLQGKKLCPAGEGGILVTDDADLNARATLAGHFKQKNASVLPAGHPLSDYVETGSGLKLRIHPLAASIGLHTLQHSDTISQGRRKCAAEMWEILADCPHLTLLGPLTELSLYNLPLLLTPQAAPWREDMLCQLREQGYTHFFKDNLVGVMPQMAVFQRPESLFPDYPLDQYNVQKTATTAWPVATDIQQRLLLLPLWYKEIDFSIGRRYANALMHVIAHLEGEKLD